MANYIGLGSGNSNPYLQAAKLNQSGPPQTYDPSQTLDATQMAQQVFQQQSAQRSQAFNQENPRMALPQNIGAAFGGALSRAIAPKPQTNPDQPAQPDISSVIQSEYTKRFMQILSEQQGTKDYGSAQYQAATSIATDPQLGQSPITQAIAQQYIKQAKEGGYTPESAASTDASIAQKKEAVATEKEKEVQTQVAINAAKDNNQYVPIKWTKDPTTGNMYPQQTGPFIPRYIDDNLKEDPDLQIKKNAAIAAAGGAQAGADVMPLEQFNKNKQVQQQMAQETALAKIAAQEKERQDAVNNVNQAVAQANGKRLHDGDMTLQDISGSSAAAVAMRTASTAAADAFGPWSPTDMANRKAAERSWMSGADHQTFMKAATVPRHLDDLEQISQTLQSGQFVPGNAWYQKAMRMVGADPGTTVPSFDLAKQVFALELSGALNQRGGTNDDRIALTNQIKAADAPQTLANTLRTEEKLWADKFADMKASYETNVSGKKFFGDLVNPRQQPQATEMFSKYYPIDINKGDAEKYYFDQLSPNTTVRTAAGRVLKAGQLRALAGAQ